MVPLKAFGLLLFCLLVLFNFIWHLPLQQHLGEGGTPWGVGHPAQTSWVRDREHSLLNPLHPSIPPHLLWHLRPGGRQPVFPPAPLSPHLPPAHPQLPPKQGEAPLPTHQPRGRSPKGPRAASPLSSTWPLPKPIPPANPRLVPLALCSRQIPRLQTKRPGGLQGTRLAPSQPC